MVNPFNWLFLRSDDTRAAIMQESYVALLIGHMLLAVTSPVLFTLRAWRGSRGLEPAAGWLRYTPHVVDSLLLAAGLSLCRIIHEYPFRDAWLTAKLLALIAYVGVGHVAVRRARRPRSRLAAWLAAMALLFYIFAVALTHDPAAGLAP